ncbi:MAG TPA: cytochrome c oxidase assembly factor Coa1 family protein [Acidobacteriaceae bacterium]|jgi:hypothetical protein
MRNARILRSRLSKAKYLAAAGVVSFVVYLVSSQLFGRVGSRMIPGAQFIAGVASVWVVFALVDRVFDKRETKILPRSGRILLKLFLIAPVFYLAVGVLQDALVRQQRLTALIQASLDQSGITQNLLEGRARVAWPVTGSLSLEGHNGYANLSVPVVGANRCATVQVSAVKENGSWHIRSISINR